MSDKLLDVADRKKKARRKRRAPYRKAWAAARQSGPAR